MKKIIPLLIIFIMISGCTAVSSKRTVSQSPSSGYFLSMSQKGELIWSGKIQDDEGNWYDIWIVPGYTEPARQSKINLRKSKKDFAEYTQAKKYRDLVKDSKDAFEWAYNDCLLDFTVKGVPRAWDKYWSTARFRTKKKVFGWWLVYPWAFLEGVVDNSFRVPVGLTGSLAGAVWGSTVVPIYHATNSTVKGSWHFGVEAVLLPAIGATWNTVISPPMALLGQKPAPSRADGFWMKRLNEKEIKAAKILETPLTGQELVALASWGRLLLTTTQPFEVQRQALHQKTKAEHDAIKMRSQKAERKILTEEETSIRPLADNDEYKELIDQLRSHDLDAEKIRLASAKLRKFLKQQQGLSPDKIQRIMQLLKRYPPITNPPGTTIRPKTDPVKHSIQIINTID